LVGSHVEVSRGRAVLLVANTAAPYSRGLRVARSLAAAGWEVEIAAVSGPDVPDEERDGDIVTRRYHPSGPLKRWSGLPPTPKPPTKLLKDLVRRGDRGLKAWLWPLHVRGWWRTLRRELPPADVYHAFGILTVPVAVELGATARRAGREGIVIYDVIDAILDSNNYANVPPALLDRYRKKEASWVRKVDAVVTVNEALADHCERIWPFRERPTVLFNGQERWDPPTTRPDLIREAAGLPKERSVVLYLGRLGRERGLEYAAEAILRLRDAALVMLGFPVTKGWDDKLAKQQADPRFAGRYVALPPVHPDQVRIWAASADVSIIAVPANSLNQRLSTPNKFWESLAAGTPVVLGRDLEVMRAMVEADRLGAIADPEDHEDLARALREILEQPRPDYEAMRERCLTVSRERYAWEVVVRPYLALVDRLTTPSDAGVRAA
jgi:glycosyltransferase involved in cell wall biosynthesis